MDYETLTNDQQEEIRRTRLGTLERQHYEHELASADGAEMEKSKDEDVKMKGKAIHENSQRAMKALEAEMAPLKARRPT